MFIRQFTRKSRYR